MLYYMYSKGKGVFCFMDSVEILKSDIELLLSDMARKPDEYDQSLVSHYWNKLTECSDVFSFEVLFSHVLSLYNDWVTFD